MFSSWNPFKFLQKPQSVNQAELTEIFQKKYSSFKELLDSNSEMAAIIADMTKKLQGEDLFGMSYVRSQTALAVFHALRMIRGLNALSNNNHALLYQVLEEIQAKIRQEIREKEEQPLEDLVLSYYKINKDMVDWVGGKNANLGEVLNKAGLPIPEGFAITTRAFRFFLEENDLIDHINKQKMGFNAQDPEEIQQISQAIQRLILTAEVPPKLEQEILNTYDTLLETMEEHRIGSGGLWMAMRSSAVGEDSELSFAGQYVSVLNVAREKLASTYKIIVASLYTPRAITYRFNKGIRDEDVAMSVACLRMVHSVASGVMYSRHPFYPADNHVIITAVWGLGPYAVDGVITPDTYHVAKDTELTVTERNISHKPVQLVTDPKGGLQEIAVPEPQQNAACLDDRQIKALASYARKLEEHYGGPQDIEWTLDQQGRLLILQSRPLHLKHSAQAHFSEHALELDGETVLVAGGQAAFPGVGYGKAYHVHSEEDLFDFPEDGILIARHSSPQYVVVMPKAAAIITDSGSVTGHMASLAREFEVPSILDAKTATLEIPNGTEITVDAYGCKVYAGRVEALIAKVQQREPYMKDTPVYDTFKRVSKWIIPLHLLNPKAPNFNQRGCESLHDIMRYVHEVSYGEMFKISDVVSGGEGAALKLESPIPLDLHIIDLGGGLTNLKSGAKKVKAEQVSSLPFKALLRGMLHEDLVTFEPRPIELKGFLSVMTQQMLAPPNLASERFGDRSYAILSDKYLNFSSRVGYHYSVLDSYCGDTVNKNYITFSFMGGAADEVRRNRRARLIAHILRELHFSVDVVADRTTARFQKYERSLTEERLDLLGRLLLFTRQMDMIMNNEQSVTALADRFLEGKYKLN